MTATLQDQPSGLRDLQALRQFRDEVLAASPAGQRYIDLYYRHAPEVTLILLRDRDLRLRATHALNQFMPGIRDLLGPATDQELILISSRIRQIDSLLAEISNQGSPELRGAIDQFRSELRGWQGKSVRQVWQELSE